MSETTAPITIMGRAFPAHSSREVPARLVLSPGRVAVYDDLRGLISETDPAQVAFDMPVGQAPRRATLPDGTLFETEDREAFDSLRAHDRWHVLHRAERFGPGLIWVVVAAIFGIFLIWRFALPAMVSVAILLTPDPLERAIDRGTLQSFDATFANPTKLSEEKQTEIRVIFDELLAELPDNQRSGKSFNLHFRDTPEMGPNALALPGGTIVMTDQLVAMFDDEDVFAGVLGHEIGHVIEDHGLTQLYRSVGLYVLVALIAGDTGPILEDVLLEGGVLLSLSFSREHERNADGFGLRLSDAAGYDPKGLLTFFKALPDSEETEAGWGSTHPASGARIEAIEDYLRRR